MKPKNIYKIANKLQTPEHIFIQTQSKVFYWFYLC